MGARLYGRRPATSYENEGRSCRCCSVEGFSREAVLPLNSAIRSSDPRAACFGRLAHCYAHLFDVAVAETAASLTSQGRHLQGVLGDEAPKQLRETMASLAGKGGNSPEPETVNQALLAMHQIGQTAITRLRDVVNRHEAAVAQYDLASAAFEKHASAQFFARDVASAELQQYARTVQTRFQGLIDPLIENRFDALVFRQMLVEQVLAQDALVELLESLADTQANRLCDGWREVAEHHAIPWLGALPQSRLEIDGPVNEFLRPIQLFYERPGVIRSVLRLGRGKLQEKLAAEVDEGTAKLTRALMRLVEDQWQKTAEHCRSGASRALQEWIRSTTGKDRESCLREVAAARVKIDSLTAWLKNLASLNVTDWLLSKRESVRHAATARIVSRLRAEQRQ
jgi:adenosyl cobinamide kinase/adenosyl cobinamide phosphate guanylyltransferase